MKKQESKKNQGKDYFTLPKEKKAIRRKSWLRITKNFLLKGPASWQGKKAGRVWTYVVDFLQLTVHFDFFGQASSVVYYMLLAFFPFLILAMYFVSILAANSNLSSELIHTIKSFLPGPILTITESLIENISTSLSGFALVVSVLTTLWAASRGIGQVFSSIAQIYPRREKGLTLPNRIMGILLTIIIFLILGTATIMMSFGRVVLDFIDTNLNFIELNRSVIDLITYGTSLLLIFLILLIFYYISAKRSAEKIPSVPGAIIASISWIVLSYFYSFYIANKANLVSLYGSLANIIILMLWLNFSVQIILSGAIINYQIAWYRVQKKESPQILYRTIQEHFVDDNPFDHLETDDSENDTAK